MRAAVPLFATAGFHATPVIDIAHSARVTPLGIFQLYPRKSDLFIATIEHCYNVIVAELTRLANDRNTSSCGTETCSAVVQRVRAQLAEDPHLLVLRRHLHDDDVQDPTVHHAISTAVTRLEHLLLGTCSCGTDVLRALFERTRDLPEPT
jgi:AcrR family transcriptional regulator